MAEPGCFSSVFCFCGMSSTTMHSCIGDALSIPRSYCPEETKENAFRFVFPFYGGYSPQRRCSVSCSGICFVLLQFVIQNLSGSWELEEGHLSPNASRCKRELQTASSKERSGCFNAMELFCLSSDDRKPPIKIAPHMKQNKLPR